MFEINLVPDVKAELIRAQKTRNLVYFLCILVAAVAVGIVLLLFMVWTGQNIKMSSQDASLDSMSKVLDEYDGLDELLTIESQLKKLNTIGGNKKLLSRVFNILGTLLPAGTSENEDRITLSELSVNLDESTLTFDAQAYAGAEPRLNYRVLEAFSKSIPLMRYDYGRYVTEEGNEIPTRCIVETDGNGALLTKGREEENGKVKVDGGIYVKWLKGESGCNPDEEESESNSNSNSNSNDSSSSNRGGKTWEDVDTEGNYIIWRTPQTTSWYSNKKMETDGTISGVAHFESKCIVYSGIEDGGTMKWSSTNDCALAAEEGALISDSVDAVESGGSRVLRFNAVIYLNEEVFKFSNKHMMAIAPTGKTNVTDSYVQIGGMFSERAQDVKEGE